MRNATKLALAASLLSVPLMGAVGASAADSSMGDLYSNVPTSCAATQPAAPVSAGFVTAVPQGDGTVQVNLHLRNASPNTTYSVANTCHEYLPYSITTNSKGVGNVSFSFVPDQGQTVLVLNGTALGGSASGYDGYASTPISLS